MRRVGGLAPERDDHALYGLHMKTSTCCHGVEGAPEDGERLDVLDRRSDIVGTDSDSCGLWGLDNGLDTHDERTGGGCNV